MARPNTVSWDILRNHADVFVSAPRLVARLGMALVVHQLKGDTQLQLVSLVRFH